MPSDSSSISANNAFLAAWICSAFTFTILLLRLAAIHKQLGRPDTSTYVILLSIVILTARVICNYYIIKDGTVGALKDAKGPISNSDLAHARIGSILSLVARMLITTFYWLMCVVLLLVYRRILSDIQWVRKFIRVTWVVMATTYVAVILTTFLECRPFHLYWQLSPDPGSCAKSYAQLLVQCVSNIIIDLLLMAISMPILRAQARVFPHNLQLGSIVILGTFCIIITSVRIYYTYQNKSAQNARSFWASIQALIAAFVANAPSIYGAFMLARRKKMTQSGRFTDGTDTTHDEVALTDEPQHRRSEASRREGSVPNSPIAPRKDMI